MLKEFVLAEFELIREKVGNFVVCDLMTLVIGPLQLAIHVVQNRHAGEQKSHWDKTNKRHTGIILNGNFLC